MWIKVWDWTNNNFFFFYKISKHWKPCSFWFDHKLFLLSQYSRVKSGAIFWHLKLGCSSCKRTTGWSTQANPNRLSEKQRNQGVAMNLHPPMRLCIDKCLQTTINWNNVAKKSPLFQNSPTKNGSKIHSAKNPPQTNKIIKKIITLSNCC